jgi:single-strand DNA-binding protein
MAVGETSVTMTGTVLSEVDFKRIGDEGHELVTFLLRSNERRFDKAKREWVDGRHLTVRVKCWRRLALGVRSAVRKGDPVIVNGRLYTNDFDDRRSRAVPEVEAVAVGPNLALCVAPVQRGKRAEPGAEAGCGAWQASDSPGGKPLVEAAEPVPVG